MFVRVCVKQITVPTTVVQRYTATQIQTALQTSYVTLPAITQVRHQPSTCLHLLSVLSLSSINLLIYLFTLRFFFFLSLS